MEAELVSKFNVEYFGIGFASIFIAGNNNFFCYIILFIFRNLLYSEIFMIRSCIVMI